MTLTHTIILAQGTQARLPDLSIAKQLLPLPACADTPILRRTLRQLWHVLDGINVDPAVHGSRLWNLITVVTWPRVEEALRDAIYIPQWQLPGIDERCGWAYRPDVVTLADPGNSSLKGIACYLDKAKADRAAPSDRTVVLLGDVVYSWAALRAIYASATFEPDSTGMDVGHRFTGTSDLSTTGGELWSVAWNPDTEPSMMAALQAALAKHPPFADTYQPGQLRRWLWACAGRPGDPYHAKAMEHCFRAIDDYTMDIDIPAHLAMLPALSEKAAADDAENGVTWP